MNGEHLKTMLRHVCLRGTDIKLLSQSETGSQSVMSPYPAYRWDWKVRLAFPWKQNQHINVLEVTACPVKFRRRTRDRKQLANRFLNVTDSQVMFRCLTKGGPPHHASIVCSDGTMPADSSLEHFEMERRRRPSRRFEESR